jgi:rhodanese-related sulfurtransferase
MKTALGFICAAVVLTCATAQHSKAGAPQEIERITVDELKAKLAKREPVTIIDSRSASSYEAGDTKIKGAIRIAPDEVEARLKEIPRDKEVVVYCA